MKLMIFPLVNYHTKRLMVLASIVSALFFVLGHYHESEAEGPAWEGAITAYNFYKHNSIFYWYENQFTRKQYEFISEVPASGAIVGNHPIAETIGWSIIAGLLWKLFDYPSMLFMQFLSIILFIISMLYLYR